MLAGVAIVIRVADVLAARLLAAMLLVFGAATLLPLLFAGLTEQGNWGANLYNFVAAESAWIFAEYARGHRSTQLRRRTR